MYHKILSLVLLVTVLASCNGYAGNRVSSVNQGDLAAQTNSSTVAQSVPAAVKSGQVVEVSLHQSKVSAGENKPADLPAVPPVPAAAEPPAPVGSGSAQANVPSAVGPDSFPAGINPLTGLPVKNSQNLVLSPALVSVTNFPVTARPQAGLSFSPFVFEMYIGEGMTRFLALFYGDYPVKGDNSGISLSDDKIGPVRSGRLPYESLRKLYNGFLVMASASSVVLPSLSGYTNVFGSDTSDINSAMIPATRLAEVAARNPTKIKSDALTGLSFNSEAPKGGQAGKMLWIPYNFLNQVIWRYDQASGTYLRYQDDADGKTFIQATDRLNKKPLQYSNVVVLFANHQAKRETLINIDLMYINKMPALLFRDGKMYKIYWTTANGAYEKKTGMVRPIRFIDDQGNPFPLKQGQTWVEIVPQFTPYNETVDSQTYMQLKTQVTPGSGNWAIHFTPAVPER